MTVVSAAESKDTLKKSEKNRSRIKDLITSVTNNTGDYEEKYMKIKFNSDEDLPSKKTLKFCIMILGQLLRHVISTVFHEGNKVFLDEE